MIFPGEMLWYTSKTGSFNADKLRVNVPELFTVYAQDY